MTDVAFALQESSLSAEFKERFSPIFRLIAEGTVLREHSRELPFEAVDRLRKAGFGALRVPTAYGGFGATLPQLFELLSGLGEADSNLVQILRAHFGFVEDLLNIPDPALHDRWFPKIVAGELFGAAMSERMTTTPTKSTIELTALENGGWLLDGEKYYSTGSLYADWVAVLVIDDGEAVGILVPGNAPGVTRLDDWDGFGQRLTASGTTRFSQVRVGPEQIYYRYPLEQFPPKDSYLLGFYQAVHLATLAGIARAVLRDAVAFVQQRNRTGGSIGAGAVGGESSPRKDPLVQRVVGRLASLSFSAGALIENVAAVLERTYQARLAGLADAASYAAANLQVYQAQQIVIGQVLEATTLLFEVGGASSISASRQLDRHWRNARTLATHNPAILRERALGDYYLNGVFPDDFIIRTTDPQSRESV